MELSSPQKEIYAKDRFSAVQAQRLAQEIAFGPVVFQVSRLMVKFGSFGMLREAQDGLTMDEIAEKTGLSHYAVTGVVGNRRWTIGTILLKDGISIWEKPDGSC